MTVEVVISAASPNPHMILFHPIHPFHPFHLLHPFHPISLRAYSSGSAPSVRSIGLGDYRSISLENCIFPHLSGSSRVKVEDSTDVICSISFEVSEPNQDTPEDGFVAVYVDISPSCKTSIEDRALQTIGSQFASNLRRYGWLFASCLVSVFFLLGCC